MTSRSTTVNKLMNQIRGMSDSKRTKKIGAYPAVPVGSPAADSQSPWEIALTGDLSDRQSDLISKLVELPANSKGIIYFDSCGGSVYAGLALATVIRTRQLKATAVVVGECSSAALMPFAVCRRRLVTPLCTMLFHPMRWQSDEDVRLEEAAEWARHFEQLEGDLDQLLVKAFPVDNDVLQKWTRPGRFVRGTELADAGLAGLYDPFSLDNPWNTLRAEQHQ